MGKEHNLAGFESSIYVGHSMADRYFDLLTAILRWVRRIDYTKKEILAKFCSHIIMVLAKTMSNTASL